ncbi:MAG: DUF2281 domain-containing protein [Niameybacter sp.]|uniref:DUF2281 domain-containing protein n=1 Tax=Niameybacter sp. TaxID=2033640 RepID=UPI002FC82D55
MTAIQKLLHELVEELPDKEAAEVVDFIEYLKLKKEKELYRELQQVSESSLDFWDNEIDDEVCTLEIMGCGLMVY